MAVVVIPLGWVLFWVFGPFGGHLADSRLAIGYNPLPEGMLPVGEVLSVTTRVLGCLVGFLPLAVWELILYYLILLFKAYEQGDIFSYQTVRYLQYVGYAVVAGQVLHPFYEALLSLVLTWHHPRGERMISIGFSGTNLGLLLAALMIILIAWIMREGCRLKEEQDYTV